MKKTIANKGRRPTTLTRGAVKRIARAVNAYERGDRNIPPRKFRSYGGGGDGGGGAVRLCQTSGPWHIGEEATLAVIGGESGETLEAHNVLMELGGSRHVFVAKSADDGLWYLVAAELEAIQVVTNVNLTGSELVFSRHTVWAVPGVDPGDTSIPVTDCAE